MENPTFEQRLKKVQDIITGIESGQMPLEEAVTQYETGMQSLNELEKDLAEMNRRITILQKNPDGSLEEIPLEDAP